VLRFEFVIGARHANENDVDGDSRVDGAQSSAVGKQLDLFIGLWCVSCTILTYVWFVCVCVCILTVDCLHWVLPIHVLVPERPEEFLFEKDSDVVRV